MARKLPAGMTMRADGRIVNRFTVEGKRYSVYGTSVKECRDKESLKRDQIKAGIATKGKDKTVGDYFEEWISAKEGTVKPTTIRTDHILLNRMAITPIDNAGTMFGSLKLSKVETSNVRALQGALQKELRYRTDKGKEKTRKGMTTRATNDSIHLLKAVYKSAIAERLVNWNPVDTVKPIKRTEEQARDTNHRALTREETALFLECAKARNSWYYNLYVFLLNTGARLGEAGALLPSDISKDGITIKRTITRTEDGGYMIGQDTKTSAGIRFIPMMSDAVTALDNQRKANAVSAGGKVIELGKPIFRAPRGSLLKSANVNYDISNICAEAGIDKFSCHAFRATFATRCVESGMPAKTLMSIMGHSDISMTLTLYAHCEDETKIEQLKAVNFM